MKSANNSNNKCNYEQSKTAWSCVMRAESEVNMIVLIPAHIIEIAASNIELL